MVVRRRDASSREKKEQKKPQKNQKNKTQQPHVGKCVSVRQPQRDLFCSCRNDEPNDAPNVATMFAVLSPPQIPSLIIINPVKPCSVFCAHADEIAFRQTRPEARMYRLVCFSYWCVQTEKKNKTKHQTHRNIEKWSKWSAWGNQISIRVQAGRCCSKLVLLRVTTLR